MAFITNTSSSTSLTQAYPSPHTISIASTSFATTSTISTVPFLSQFSDITSPTWKAVGCGVTSLAMVINFFGPDTVTVDALLHQGIAAGAYLQDSGWSYKGLISLAQSYGLDGSSYDLKGVSDMAALKSITTALASGPVIASIHYKFNPKSTIPHLVVITGIKDGIVYYNDPAAKSGNGHLSTADFIKGWKKRYIVVRPVAEAMSLAHVLV